MKHGRWVILLSVVLLAGCSSTVRIGETEYAPRAANYPIEVFFGPDATAQVMNEYEDDARPAGEIPPEAVEVGRTDSSSMTYTGILRSAQKVAREFGGDGVVLHGFHSTGVSINLTTTLIRWNP